jgi:hypothetical protein
VAALAVSAVDVRGQVAGGNTHGGVLHVRSTTSVTVAALTAANVSTPCHGGALFLDDPMTSSLSALTLTRCASTAGAGGGLFLRLVPTATRTATVANATLDGCTAASRGGGLAVEADTGRAVGVTVTGVTVTNSSAAGGGGGMAFVVNNTALADSSSGINATATNASDAATGVEAVSAAVTTIWTRLAGVDTLTGNATAGGGGGGSGGSSSVSTFYTDILVSGCTLRGNNAGGSPLTASGGGLPWWLPAAPLLRLR